jgi:cytochrome c-type biogenesis protein CcmH/NrfG
MSNPRVAEKSRRQTPLESSFKPYLSVVPIAVVLLTASAFYPIVHNKFINWDDYKNIVENSFFRGFGWTNIQWMFTTFHMGHYQPLTWLILGIDYLIWGLNPAGYHLSNLLFHCANAVVLYFVAFRLFLLADAGLAAHKGFLLPLGAGFAALLFSLHPLRVESVAWATERRDVVSGLLILLTVLCYLKAKKIGETRLGSRRWMTISLALYLLSLLSKASGITLPLVLLVLDVYPLRRLGQPSIGWFGPTTRNVWREKIPFFVLALGAGVIALTAQYHARALKPVEQYDIASRLTQSLYGIGFYLWKTVLPFSLSPLYEVPLTPDPWRWSFLLSGLLVVGITVALFVRRRVWPAILASWIVYVVLLVPTSGIAQSGPQLVADRYSYLSCMVWAVVAGGGISHLLQLTLNRGVAPHMFAAIVVFVALVLVGFGVLTWKQTQVWHDSERLWRHALSIDPESSFAHNNLANALADQGRLDEATVEIREVLRINPRDADGYYNLGNFLARQGKLGEAVDRFHEALRIQPGHAEAHYDLGNALARRGELDVAVAHFRQALFLAPQDAKAHYNLGQIFVRQGKLDEAIRHYRLALRIDPAHVKARYYLAVALAEQGDFEGADKEFRQALRLEPNLAEAHAGLARALSAQGKKDEAVRHYQEAVRLLKSQTQNRNTGPNK